MANWVIAGAYRRLVVPPRSRLLLAVLALAASAGGAWAMSRPPAPCQGAPPSDIVVEDGQRIGYQFCGPSFADGDLEQAVYAENLQASRLAGNGRLVVTMLLVTALTNSPQNSRSIVAEQEGLAGAYAAQMRINSTAGNLPLVRIAVANAGYAASHADTLAHRVRALVDADPTVVAAVVTLDSIDVVHQGLARLTGTGLAMASPTMSADGFGAGLPTFLQLTASNSDQAQLAFDYATRVAPRAAIVVIRPDPDTGDRYTATLSSAMAAAGPGVTEVRWAPAQLSLSSICAGAAPRPVV
ncbi:MAG: hypothetical protein QOE61_3663 [Micromonosporaceae bacterium]|nr:hypothetical protein [Micromonosporaceae bacterium]